MSILSNKKILVGVTGGIAAYKSAELVRLLRQKGASVRVIMTSGAQSFVTPLTFQALSGEIVHTELLDPLAEAGMGHIELAKWADRLIVVPASANFMARLAGGHADDLLTTVCLATDAFLAIAPAMNQAMWRNAATQHNVQVLRNRGIQTWGPAEGVQACGDVGLGRMLEAAEIVKLLEDSFSPQVFAGKKVLITAGPTREAIDPVRFISNHSSGKMGYALARAAFEAGAEVTLLSGPTSLPDPVGVTTIRIESAKDMHAEALARAPSVDVFIASAAVADYAPANQAAQKIKKEGVDKLQLVLVKNPDIVASVAQLSERPFVVGFAAETENVLHYAQSKLRRKKLDLIVANDVSDPSIGFNSDRNAVWLVDHNGEVVYPEQDKYTLARNIVREIAERLRKNVNQTS